MVPSTTDEKLRLTAEEKERQNNVAVAVAPYLLPDLAGLPPGLSNGAPSCSSCRGTWRWRPPARSARRRWPSSLTTCTIAVELHVCTRSYVDAEVRLSVSRTVLLTDRGDSTPRGCGRFKSKTSRQKCLEQPQSAHTCRRHSSELQNVSFSPKASHSVLRNSAGRVVLLDAEGATVYPAAQGVPCPDL